MMDKIDKQYELKKFLMRAFKGAIVEGNNLKENEYIRILRLSKKNDEEFQNIDFFKNIDDVVDFCTSKKCLSCNTYFTLATTNAESGQAKDLKKAYTLGFDFDKKDYPKGFNHKDVLNRFRDINLKYHMIVDSGHGYHVYVFLEETDDLERVNKVTKAIATKIGSDLGATKITQVLRVPCTYNTKDKRKMVKVIHMEDISHKRYDIDNLHKRFCYEEELGEDVNTRYLHNNTNMKPCVVEVIQNGSKEHCNNLDLQKIVIELRHRNKSLEHVKHITSEWNVKNEISWSKNELEYQTEKMYKDLLTTDFGCANCSKREECTAINHSNFEYNEDEKILDMTESDMRYLKKSKRKGVRTMEGSELVVYGILKNHIEGLSREELIGELTYKKKCLFSKNTLTKILNNLEDNKFIKCETVNKFKLYKVVETKSKIELKYRVSYAATYECIKGHITTDELRLYNFMRYLHHKEQRENPQALKGNLFQMTQIDIAKELGVTQGRVSQMLNNLLEEKIISPFYRGKSKNNGFEYHVYRLNY